MEMSVEFDGEDVTERLARGETIYFVPSEVVEPEPTATGQWPEGWTQLGVVVED
jgi:hypothetical protein